MSGANFGESFIKSFDIHRALSDAVLAAEPSARVVLADVVKSVVGEQWSAPPSAQAELQLAIIRAAADAGIDLWIGEKTISAPEGTLQDPRTR
jgi:hypothetical protein